MDAIFRALPDNNKRWRQVLHFEGPTLPGWQHHLVLTALGYGFLQNERRRRGQTQLTLPRVRAVITEVPTAHFFMTQPDYLKWMLKLKEVELRN